MFITFFRRYSKYLLLALVICGSISAFPADIQSVDSVYNKKTFTGEELIRGERLFYGLVYFQGKSINCAGCHNTIISDTLNWNPDAMQVSVRYSGKSALDLSKVLLSPAGKKMAEVHSGFRLTPEEITLIKAFMDRFVTIGLRPDKPAVANLLLFILACILLLGAVTDLIITKKFRKKWILSGILGLTTVYITYVLTINAIKIGRTQDYSPDQPVKFSHAVHAGQNKIDCIYCHSYVHVSKTAGIPPVNVCMNCHLLVRSGTRSGTFEIAKIINAHDNNVPVKWIKVHNLPDHVFFSHAQHTGPGNIACSECHGKVEEKHMIEQVSDLSMGWCINCHRTRKISFEENKFYSDYKDLSSRIRSELSDTVTIKMLGGTECMKCHY
jgi:hypothetical protein